MRKYDPLMSYLESQHDQIMLLRFEAIESIIGQKLPRSAYQHRAWWSNETEVTHVQARSWLDSGWRVASVDISQELVQFARCQ
jgi:hypothetical protein